MACCTEPERKPQATVAQAPSSGRGFRTGIAAGQRVLAEMTGRCPGCGEDIEIGDPISKDDERGLWLHEECV